MISDRPLLTYPDMIAAVYMVSRKGRTRRVLVQDNMPVKLAKECVKGLNWLKIDRRVYFEMEIHPCTK